MGTDTSDDINLVTLRNSFAALNDENKVLENVVTSTAGKDVTNTCEDIESDVDDVYGETANIMAPNSSKGGSSGGNPGWYEHWKDMLDDDSHYYDEYDAVNLTEDQRAFCDALDIKLHGKLNWFSG